MKPHLLDRAQRFSLAVVFALAWLALPAGSLAAPALQGWLALTAGSFEAAPTFLDAGFGKLLAGDIASDASAEESLGEARLALGWSPAPGWRFFCHGVARSDPRSTRAASGLLEAYVEHRSSVGGDHEIGLRLGQFFLPASRENVDPLWGSPYTLTLSALNSWIAEEVRPIGLDARWSRVFDSGQRWSLAGTLFGGNDSAGALLAWRGFALHGRPTPSGRRVPLPLVLEATFPEQDRRGTTPFGEDLDGRPGFAGRARWESPQGRALLQATAFLNDGDRALHGGEYAWRTDFRWLSGEVDLPAGWRVLGEWGTGFSSMGAAPPGQRSRFAVDIRFDTYFALVSWQRGALRTSLRFDDFRIEDLDSTPGDDNREQGSAWTLAVMASIGERWRAGVELLDLEAERPAAARAGVPPLDGRSFLAELRYRF